MRSGTDRGNAAVVCLGEPLIAFVADRPGPLHAATSFTPHVVGAESNVAVGLARLGVPALLIGRRGDDAFGLLIERTLRAETVDTQHLSIDPDRPTGLLIRDRRGFGPSEVTYYRERSAGSRLDPGDIVAAQAALADAAWLHVSGVTLAISSSALQATALDQLAAQHGINISLDVNLRRKLRPLPELEAAPCEPIAQQSAFLFAGPDQAAALTHDPNPETAGRRLARMRRPGNRPEGGRGLRQPFCCATREVAGRRAPALRPPSRSTQSEPVSAFAAGSLAAEPAGPRRPTCASRRARPSRPAPWRRSETSRDCRCGRELDLVAKRVDTDTLR